MVLFGGEIYKHTDSTQLSVPERVVMTHASGGHLTGALILLLRYVLTPVRGFVVLSANPRRQNNWLVKTRRKRKEKKGGRKGKSLLSK